MSLISVDFKKDSRGNITDPVAPYFPDQTVKDRIQYIRNCLVIGYANQTTPRREFNDLSLLERMSVDRMSWNTYQPNDGDPYEGDPQSAWKSNAIKPVVRNKAISIAAHTTAAVIFPSVFAEDQSSNEDRAAAKVMRSLSEWTAYQSKYNRTFVHAVINAITDPCTLIYTEYCEVYKKNKVPNAQGGYTEERMLDADYSGFQDSVIQANELYIENFYEHDIQKQGFLILRKVITYNAAKAKYKDYYDNFKYVQPGMQVVYSEANNIFYYVYDPNLVGDLVEELTFWSKDLDVKTCMVNGVIMPSDVNEPNPRLDKQYPFSKSGYEYIDGGRFFYYKSLVFKMGPDAKIVNELYPMIVDGTYLSLFPPMMSKGGEEIGSEVIIPGAVTTLSAPDADLKPINTSNNLTAGMNTLSGLLQSLTEDSMDPNAALSMGGRRSAYQMSQLANSIKTSMSLFMGMVSNLVEDFGYLRVSDIIQYLTVGEMMELQGKENVLKYKTFLLPESKEGGKLNRSRKIIFDSKMPDEDMTEADLMKLSLDILKLEGGPDGKKEIFKVNPSIFRNLKYHLIISPDTMNPLSKDIEHAFKLEAYDRMIGNPTLDQKVVTKDFLLNAYDISQDDPDKYFAKQLPIGPANTPGVMGQQGQSPSAYDIMNKTSSSAGEVTP